MTDVVQDNRLPAVPLILIVDDDSRACKVLRAILELEGCRVATASNGRAALTLLASTRPSLILCDVRMPVLDGYEFIKEVQARSEFRSIPVILMSGSERPRGLPSGCCAFFFKPLDLDALIRLARHLRATPAERASLTIETD